MDCVASMRRLALAGLIAVAASVPAIATAADAAALERRVQRLENILDSGQLADVLQRLDTLEQEIRELRGAIESDSHRLDELRERQRNLYEDLDRRLRDLEIAASRAPAAEAPDEGADAATAQNGDAATADQADAGASETPSDPATERKDYDAAFELLKNGRYNEAASAFQEFLGKHPDGPYADNAQYWLGEARYVTRQFEPALEAFRAVTEQHPDSAKVPDARLKTGYTLYEMGRLDEAREALRQVVREHKDSAVARLAEERLLRIKNESQE